MKVFRKMQMKRRSSGFTFEVTGLSHQMSILFNYHRILSFVQLYAPRRILIGMCNTFPTAYSFALGNTTRRMCQLKDTCARDMKMSCLNIPHDFGQVC